MTSGAYKRQLTQVDDKNHPLLRKDSENVWVHSLHHFLDEKMLNDAEEVKICLDQCLPRKIVSFYSSGTYQPEYR